MVFGISHCQCCKCGDRYAPSVHSHPNTWYVPYYNPWPTPVYTPWVVTCDNKTSGSGTDHTHTINGTAHTYVS